MYRCNICGNEVTVTKVGGGALVCCTQDMGKIDVGQEDWVSKRLPYDEENDVNGNGGNGSSGDGG